MKGARGDISIDYVPDMPGKDFEKYMGQWVVVVDDKVVWHSKSSRGLQKQVENLNLEGITPTILRVSKKSELLL